MISVVCVFNDAVKLERRLLDSLKEQTAKHELITVDNRRNEFGRASAALNWGATRASGDWIMFVHQDVSLLSKNWLSDAENLLTNHKPTGWVGIAGVTRTGEGRGLLRDSAMLRGQAFAGLAEVQTLDEVVLIHRRNLSAIHYFDEQLPGWHAYGVEACCSAALSGARNYVIPLPIWHDSERTNVGALADAHAYVWQKHGASMGAIFTTCGVLPPSRSASRTSLLYRVGCRVRSIALRLYGFKDAYLKWFEETLEACTEGAALVECLHDRAAQPPIEAEAFVSLPKRARRVVHRFSGLEFESSPADCVVVATDLGARLSDSCEEIDLLRRKVRRLLVCLNMSDARAKPKLWRALLRRSVARRLTLHNEGTHIAVLEMRRK